MKISILILTFVLSLTSFGSPLGGTPDVSGKWSFAADAGGQVIAILVELKQTGDTFTGTTSSEMGDGTIDGGKLTDTNFTATLHATIQGTLVDFAMSGTVDGDKMTGTFANPQFGSVPFTATKNK